MNGFGFSKTLTGLMASSALAALVFTTTAILAETLADGLDIAYSLDEQISPCVTGDYATPRVLVDISGIENAEGTLRIQIYSDNPDDFLVSGKKVLRVEIPSQPDKVKVCVTFPAAGTYSMAVLHDKNSNGKADIFSEGFGFSNNPKLAFGPPDLEDTLFEVGNGVKQMDIALTYYFQLGGNDSKRRRRR